MTAPQFLLIEAADANGRTPRLAARICTGGALRAHLADSVSSAVYGRLADALRGAQVGDRICEDEPITGTALLIVGLPGDFPDRVRETDDPADDDAKIMGLIPPDDPTDASPGAKYTPRLELEKGFYPVPERDVAAERRRDGLVRLCLSWLTNPAPTRGSRR